MILTRKHRVAQQLFLLFGVTMLLTGCVYRFTNLHVAAPSGIRTIAVEAVFDTSREVLPHQYLWTALQRAFAENGHLRVTSIDQADALVRAHLMDAQVGPTESAEIDDANKDDPTVEDPSAMDPSEFRNLTKAGRHTKKEVIQIAVRVEILDLRTKKQLLDRVYTASATFQSERAEVQRKTHYLFYEEALQHNFTRLSRSISHRVVNDLLLGF